MLKTGKSTIPGAGLPAGDFENKTSTAPKLGLGLGAELGKKNWCHVLPRKMFFFTGIFMLDGDIFKQSLIGCNIVLKSLSSCSGLAALDDMYYILHVVNITEALKLQFEAENWYKFRSCSMKGKINVKLNLKINCIFAV